MRRYRDRILIQKPTSTTDAAGQVNRTYSTDTTPDPWEALDRWACVEFQSGGERTLNTKRQPQAAWSVVIPWDQDADDISPEMRILFPDENVAIEVASVHIQREGRGQVIQIDGWQDFNCAIADPFPWPDAVDPSALLLESGDTLLIETGDRLLIEA